MPFSTAPVRRLLVSCSTSALLLLAAAGCRSAQSAYQFRPASGVAAARQQPAPVLPLPVATPAVTVVADAPLAVERPRGPRPARRIRSAALRAPVRLARQLTTIKRPTYAALTRPTHRRAAATDGAQSSAEVGLGTTVLGVLGLIVGPISLLGLLIWGGPVWAVLLGLSALAVLVAYIDPFR